MFLSGVHPTVRPRGATRRRGRVSEGKGLVGLGFLLCCLQTSFSVVDRREDGHDDVTTHLGPATTAGSTILKGEDGRNFGGGLSRDGSVTAVGAVPSVAPCTEQLGEGSFAAFEDEESTAAAAMMFGQVSSFSKGEPWRRDASAEHVLAAVEGDYRPRKLGPEQENGNLRGTPPPVSVRVEFNRRDYLNGLVAMSVLTRDDQLSNLALMRTHKTGSTTLATLLYRYGRRHGLEVAQFVGSHSTIPIADAARKTQESQKYVDIMHYHIGDDGPLNGTWDEAKGLYKQVLRDPDNINFITIFREPREHLLSYYTFFIEPMTRLPIEAFLGLANPDPELLKRLDNSLCQEFGVHTPEELDHFIQSSLPEFKLVMITERFDESLMVLRHILKWHLIDMTYVFLNQTAGLKRAGEVLPDRSPFDDLPPNVRDKIDELTRMDKKLYDAGVAEFEKSKAPIAMEVGGDMVVFEQLQTVVNEYLNNNPRSPVNPMYRIRAFYEKAPPMHDF